MAKMTECNDPELGFSVNPCMSIRYLFNKEDC